MHVASRGKNMPTPKTVLAVFSVAVEMQILTVWWALRWFPTLISSQSAAAYWVEELSDRVGADSLVSRLNNGHRIRIGDFGMRKATAPIEPEE